MSKYDPFGNLTVEEWVKNLNNAFAEGGKALKEMSAGVSFIQTGEAQPDTIGVMTCTEYRPVKRKKKLRKKVKPLKRACAIYHAALAEFASGSNWMQWRDDDGEPQAFQWTGEVNPIELARQAILKVKKEGEK